MNILNDPSALLLGGQAQTGFVYCVYGVEQSGQLAVSVHCLVTGMYLCV